MARAYVDDSRTPGGSAEAIKKDYGLDAVVFDDGTVLVTGSRKNILAYFEDYAIVVAEIESEPRKPKNTKNTKS